MAGTNHTVTLTVWPVSLVMYLPTWQPPGKCLPTKIVKPNNKFQRTFFNGWLDFYCGQIILAFISISLFTEQCSVYQFIQKCLIFDILQWICLAYQASLVKLYKIQKEGNSFLMVVLGPQDQSFRNETNDALLSYLNCRKVTNYNDSHFFVKHLRRPP